MGKRILVVDDEELIRILLADFLGDKGYEVLTASNADEALKLLKTGDIYVMFFDLKMPGMDGLELCKQVRQFHPLAIIHAITGHRSLFEIVDCRKAGFDDYFPKPVVLEDVYDAVSDAFRILRRWGAI